MSETVHRSSIALRVAEAVGGTLMRLVAGAALFLPGLYGFVDELRTRRGCGEPLHTTHLSIFVALMVGGALVVQPSFGTSLTSIFVTVAPYLPVIGGKRSGDPPAPRPPADG